MNKFLMLLAVIFFPTKYLCAQEDEPIQHPVEFTPDPFYSINSVLPELNPRISADGKLLYFIREQRTQVGSEVKTRQNIWYSLMGNSWSDPQPFGPPLDHPAHNSAVLSVTPDMNQLLVLNHYLSPGVVRPGVSIVKRIGGNKWGKPEPQFIQNFVNKNRFNRSSFYLSNDGNILIGEIEGKDCEGNQDLYVSFKVGENSWSEFKNLGKTLNTTEFEFSPFLASDNRTLYFASGGHGGFGNADLFMTRRLDETWTQWSQPVNLGKPFNSPGMDAYFCLDAQGQEAFYVSNENSKGHADIKKARLPKELQPLPVTYVWGTVKDAQTQKPVSCRINFEMLPEGKIIGTAITDTVMGRYGLVLPSGKMYGIYTEKEGFMPVSTNFDLTGNTNAYSEKRFDMEMKPIEAGQSLVLNNIFFDIGTPKLKPESMPELSRIKEMMKKNPTLKVEISGHTDNTGPAGGNQKLSESRAQSVTRYLTQTAGIAPERIVSVGYGAERPVNENDTDYNRSRNRRVEFKILSK